MLTMYVEDYLSVNQQKVKETLEGALGVLEAVWRGRRNICSYHIALP
jgi:hypothetical protein